MNKMDSAMRHNLLTALGLDKLPESQQAKFLESIGRLIYEGVFMRVMDELDEKGKSEFEKVLNRAASEDDIMQFLDEHVPGIDNMIRDEIEKFKEESASFMQKLG